MLIIAAASFSACQLPDKSGEKYDFSVEAPYRCGVYRSYIYEGEPEEKVYPDLGLLLLNSEQLELRESIIPDIRKKAVDCYEKCEQRKEVLRLMEQKLKQKLKTNELKGDVTEISESLNRIEQVRLDSLKADYLCYEEGLSYLNEAEMKRWIFVENSMYPFPDEVLQ